MSVKVLVTHCLRGVANSLRLRLMLGAAAISVLFMLALLPALRGAFVIALEESIHMRLESDASALIASAYITDGRLDMPDDLPSSEYDDLDASQLAYIYDGEGKLVWWSRSSENESVPYRPQLGRHDHELMQLKDVNGREFFAHQMEVDQLRGQKVSFYVVSMQPASDYQGLYDDFIEQLYIWLSGAAVVLLALLWFGLTWGFRSLRGLSSELDEVEAGSRDSLSEKHPRELLRLTRSLNRLLDGERRQRERYRHSLDDLAHSLKTPLSVLQGVSEVLADKSGEGEQARVLQNQVERMSQQIGYQLQRASLRKSGLVRHRVRLAPLIDTLCDALDKVYRDKRVQIERKFDPGLMVPMEQGALLEMLGNLLENAYRLCLRHIRISADVRDGFCEVRVADDGPGVPANQRARILKRGERLDSQHPGQGIGTAVVKDIVESYEGELFLEDSDLGGADFRIRFPLL
nr:ATP-binding protein [Pseudomonas boanensis]